MLKTDKINVLYDLDMTSQIRYFVALADAQRFKYDCRIGGMLQWKLKNGKSDL